MAGKEGAHWRDLHSLVIMLALTLGLAGCAGLTQPTLGPEVKPELRAVGPATGPYEYPYKGLTVELDPKGYTEFAYAIEPDAATDAPELHVVKDKWMPVSHRFTLDFTPKVYRRWRLVMVLRHPSGKTAVVRKTFSVGLPPWHATATPVQFQVSARYACLWSEELTHMVQVKTLLAFSLELVHLPPGLDRSIYAGFSSTAPKVAYVNGGKKRLVPGQGGGRVESLDHPLGFAGNYQLGEKKKEYPSCYALKKRLTIGTEEWATAKIRLLDKYFFPMEATTGRVVESHRVSRETMVGANAPSTPHN